MSSPEEIKAEYTSSLADLTFNSKPLINVLTMLAEENLPNAKVIVEAIEAHLAKVDIDVKLPILYLVDCIVKNVGRTYSQLFAQNIVSTFCSVFKQVDEKTRAEMFKLRQTWNEVFPQKKLYAIDVQISLLDPAWPVTAQAPSNSIHFNPKFLKPTATTASKPLATTEAPQSLSTAAIPGIDKDTLLMQEKLLQKQRELLELQQKKLELEVLQTQVKLQEQLKTTNTPVVTKPNILLKPEVAKQLVTSAGLKGKPTGIGSAIMNQRLQTTTVSAPRINPVGGSLITAVRPSRDPRLLRQPKQPLVGSTQTNNSSSVPISQKASILENNKNVTNKMHVKRDPRLANKDSESDKPKTFLKSRQQSPSKTESDLQRSPKGLSRLKFSNDSDKSASTSKSSSTSSLIDSPKKSDRLLKSPTKNKKREKSINDDSNPKESNSKILKSSSPTGFKSSKGSKSRNYIRRTASPSPEQAPQDEDLRSLAPPEKPAPSPSDLAGVAINIPTGKGMDVDLRQIPGVISKKRSSTEAAEQSLAKKSKTEMLDALFGNEDTDLRKIPVKSDRPPTPPPPIISSSDTKLSEIIDSPKKPSSLDAIRAKLANATNRDKIMSKSFHRKKLKGREDQDLRVSKGTPSADGRSSILISPDVEKKIKSGDLTKEQQTHLLNKIIMTLEKDKLIEAKKKDRESIDLDISLQPISDDELPDPEEDPNFNDKDDRLPVQSIHHNEDNVPKQMGYYPRGRRDMVTAWRGPPTWRGRGRGQPMMPHPRPPIRPWGPKRGGMPMNVPHYPQPEYIDSPIDEDASKSPDINSDQPQNGGVHQDEMKTIAIDGIPRDIRYYGETAVVFLNWDDPREISFQSGSRRVVFNNNEAYYLSFNDPYKECLISGVPHKVRLGAPSREIFIDGEPYECFFGGASITAELDGVKVSVQLDGPVPQVKIGETKRTDLVAGKITLIINAKIVSVFLDAKTQKFIVDGETCTLKFVDALKTVLINDVPFAVEFGGLPKPFMIHDKKHFIRFSVLPRGVRPGYVRIRDMEGEVLGSPPHDDNSREGMPEHVDPNEPALPIPNRMRQPAGGESPDNRSNSPTFLQNILQSNFNNLDVLSNVFSSTISPASSQSIAGYQIENANPTSDSKDDPAPNQSVPPPPLNVNELFQKLVATGFVKTAQQPPLPKPHEPRPVAKAQNGAPPVVAKTKKNIIENLRPINFLRPETLRIRQGALYVALYTGNPCSSCGLRFPPEASMQYSQHLDWHFRQNRKGKKNIRVAASRRWYYSLADWKNYEEIEDLEEREKNYFDQQQQAEGIAEEAEDNTEVPSVPADPNRTDESCVVCNDKFDQFFNEEKEEWHLRNSIKIDDRTYHPVCYEDHLQSVSELTLDESKMEEPENSKMIPGLEIILDDDDEGQPEIVSLDDDESKPESEMAEEQQAPSEEEDDDDDVILNEVAPVKIVVDDDDDEEGLDDKSSIEPPPMKIKKEKHVDDDGFVDVGEGMVRLDKVGQIRIKTEPMDTDVLRTSKSTENLASVSILDESDIEMQAIEQLPAEAPPPGQVTTLDGNMELDGSVNAPLSVPSVSANKIKITISKQLPSVSHKEKETASETASVPAAQIDPTQPYPPGEEPEILNLKPGLQNVKLKRMPPIDRGSELSGLCSIM